MRTLIFFLITAATYYIAGMYRQMPLMILAVMEWFLLIFLFFLPRYLRRKIDLSFPLQNNEAEKGVRKKCHIRIENQGKLPLKKVRLQLKLYDDKGSLIQKYTIHKSFDDVPETIEAEICPSHCGILQLCLCRVSVYDYLSIFSASKTVQRETTLVVLPNVKPLRLLLPTSESAASLPDETPQQSYMKVFGNESREIHQIREYHMGDTMRYIHWNQSAKTGKLWFKEFERENEAFFEILLDMTLPENQKQENCDGFYEVLSALTLGLLQKRLRVRVNWYDNKLAAFMAVPVESSADYRSMMKLLYQSKFVVKSNAVEKAYQEKLAISGNGLLKCNLCLECFVVNGCYGEELRHRFTYENLDQELSGNTMVSLR